jgi:DNA topoisomerase IA
LSDQVTEYTLLIVESPVLAKRLQNVAPENVSVLATGGFLWTPTYDSATGKLGKKANKEKLDLRNELRREARYAVKIIVATDSDPSGDFIAWAIHKELKQSAILRGHLTSVSRSALLQLLHDAARTDFTALLSRLQNRFKIRHLWFDVHPNISIKDAGLIALFSEPIETLTFRTDNSQVFQSESSLTTERNQKIEIDPSTEVGWITSSPLSTFDIVASLQQSSVGGSYSAAQDLLQKTFEATDPKTGEGLITYPRTEHRSFFSDTWRVMQQQWIEKRSINEFMPVTLQEELSPDEAHDAIRPVNFKLSPQWVETHLPADIGRAYRLIYSHTLNCIKMPDPAASSYKQPACDVRFNSTASVEASRITVQPFLTVSELGNHLCKLGVLRPSGFGSFVDDAITSNRIVVNDQGDVTPGPIILSMLEFGKRFSTILTNLHSVADNQALSDETIRHILSS